VRMVVNEGREGGREGRVYVGVYAIVYMWVYSTYVRMNPKP
jgi:hypothetical protein